MIVRDRIPAGVMDFGEMCAGDPATNLRRLDPSRLPARRFDTFSDLAIAAGKSQLRLVPGSGTGHADRVRFFMRCGTDWCEGRKTPMCKPLAAAEVSPAN